jgi:membrane protein implicated in regulation of membrane protease activity
MKIAKPILLALAILIAAMVVWFIVSLVITIIQVVFVLAVIVFGISIYRKLAGKSKPQQLGEKDEDRELNESLRQLEEIKRRQQLTK